MTDLEKLLSILENKIEYYEVDNYKWMKAMHPDAEKCISLENSKTPEGFELGYSGFVSNWFFDIDGNLLGVGNAE